TLFGYSLGGLVAVEMARKLSSAGEQIGLLVLLDSYPYLRYLPTGQRLRLMVRRTRLRMAAAVLGRAPLRPASAMDRTQVVAFAPGMDRVKDCAYSALQRYQPRFYPGKVRFVRAEILSDFPDDPVAIWAHLAEEFEVETAPGDHLGM